MEKKNDNIIPYVKYGFWTMLALFIVRMALSMSQSAVVTYIGYAVEALFYVSVFFVFINSIRYLMPADKSFAVTALIVSSLFIVFIILLIVAVLLTTVMSGTTAGLIQ